MAGSRKTRMSSAVVMPGLYGSSEREALALEDHPARAVGPHAGHRELGASDHEVDGRGRAVDRQCALTAIGLRVRARLTRRDAECQQRDVVARLALLRAD